MDFTKDMQTISAEGNYLTYHSSSIHYLKFGDGDRFLIAFHGFGEQAATFLKLSPSLSPLYTIIAIDFPLHGKTDWQEDRYIEPKDLSEIVTRLMEKWNIHRISLLGFSMGGRLVFSLATLMAEKIERLILLAPDGIKTHFMFNVAVYPTWGRWLFKKVMRYPGIFLFIVRFLKRLGLISQFLHDFTLSQMGTADKRQLIVDTWFAIRNFNPSIRLVAQSINEKDIETVMIFGDRDKVIKPNSGKKLCKKIKRCRYHIVQKGHFMITESFNSQLASIIN